MAKIMLVEDDNNLREIYEARLLAEGYEIVSAKDGEEALALAVKEKPDLIIADVMMPKISGFDMLDILRTTPEIKDTKVIMMTALSQAEDKARADKLGADRYLVKSQVTLEDVAKAAREVLEGIGAPNASPPASTPAAPVTQPVADQPSVPTDPAPATIPVANEPTTNAPDPQATTDIAETTKQEEAEVNQQVQKFADAIEAKEPAHNPGTESTELPATHEKVIQPLNTPSTKPVDLNALLAKEEAKANQPSPNPQPAANNDSDGHEVDKSTPGSDPTNPHDIAL